MLSLTRSLGIAALLLPLAAAPSAGANEKTEAPGTYTLRIRTAAPEKSPWGELLNNVADRLKRETPAGMTLKVVIHWQTKSEAAAVRSCIDGKSGGIAVSFGALSSAVAEVDATEIPFLFDNYAQADKAMTAAMPLLSSILREKGFILAVRGENGFRQWASKTTFLTDPSRFVGRAMRSQPSFIHKEMYSALGATPNPLAISDVPTNLASGKVDGWDNTLLFARLANWTEGVDFITMSNHIYQGAAVVWCNAWFKDLPPELQKVLTNRDAEVLKTEQTGLQLVRVFNDKLMPKQYEEAGKKLHRLTDGERSKLKAALAPVEAAFLKQASAKGRELLETLKKNR